MLYLISFPVSPYILGLVVLTLSGGFHLVTSVLAMLGRPPGGALTNDRATISIIKTFKGVERFNPKSLESLLQLDDQTAEVLLCVASNKDPVIPVIREIMARHPGRARLLIGNDTICANPKVNNLAKGFAAASGEFVAFLDAGAIPDADLAQQLRRAMRPGIGLASAVAIGTKPENLWGRVECSFLNGLFGRLLLAAHALGKTVPIGFLMCFRREHLFQAGLASLGSCAADDAAAARIVRRSGQGINLIRPMPELTGHRSLRSVWDRQLRWAWCRVQDFCYLAPVEFILGPWACFIAATLLASSHLQLWPAATLLSAAIWYGAEAMVCRFHGWEFSLRGSLIRDCMSPFILVAAYCKRDILWKDQVLSTPRR